MPWLAVANSFVVDYLIRTKVSLHVTFAVLDSMPFPRFRIEDPLARELGTLALQLTATAPDMAPYWNLLADLGWCEHISKDAVPPGLTGADERLKARAQIEALIAKRVFGLSRSDLAYILDTFPIVREEDEAESGAYRTKDLVLDHYDRLAKEE